MTASRLNLTLAKIDCVNQADPNTVEIDQKPVAKEFIYGQQMSACLNQHWPDADEYLQIAVRAQHIKRWHIKRSEYPEGKAGYLKWRKALGAFHADLTKELMLDNGYSESDGETTAQIIRKEKLKTNANSQALEDVACLVFLQYYFAPFAEKHSEEKIISILQKTWKKMSTKAQDIAMSVTFPEHLARLIKLALS